MNTYAFVVGNFLEKNNEIKGTMYFVTKAKNFKSASKNIPSYQGLYFYLIYQLNYLDVIDDFWTRYYLVNLGGNEKTGIVNADSEKEALDFAIDFYEEENMNHVFIDPPENLVTEKQWEEWNSTHLSGGNYGLFLAADLNEIIIKEIKF